MPLPATHINFAIDLKEKFSIKNSDEYISGSVYPDSRLLTGIKRELTHNENILSTDQSDFAKGWQAHFLCDKSFNKITDKFVDIFNPNEKNRKWGSEWWIKKTAIKVLLEIEIGKTFEIRDYLKALNYVNNPNCEPIGKISKYNIIIQKLYREDISLKMIKKLLLELDFGSDLVIKIEKEISEIKKIFPEIGKIYCEMVKTI